MMQLSAPPFARARVSFALAVSFGLASPCLAEAPLPMMHGMTRGPMPLQTRVGQAQAAAIVRVESVAGGRIRLETVAEVIGSVPARFEVKRKPSAPLPLAPGDRVLLLLRGARSPYLVVDVPDDIARIADDTATRRWTEAIRAVAAAHGDPAKLQTLYVAWSEGDDDALRGEALRALLEAGGPLLPFPPALALGRARLALDATRTPQARRAATELAATDAAALDSLLSSIAAKPASADAGVMASTLRAGLTGQRKSATRALTAALHADDAELRLAALGVVSKAPREAVEAELGTLAARDPDPRVRESATHWLARLQRAR